MIKFILFSIGMLSMFLAINIFIRKKTVAFIPFSIIQFFVGYGMCVTILIDPEMGSSFQHLAKTTAPFQYLYGSLYFYFWLYMFRPNRKLKWYDVIHFFPFITSIINYLPFYSLNANEKLSIALNKNFEEFTYLHIPYEYLIKLSLILLYSIAAFIPFISTLATMLKRGSRRNRLIANWMLADLLLKLLSILAIFFNETFFLGSKYLNPTYILYSADSVINIFIIFYYPFVLNGFRGITTSSLLSDDEKTKIKEELSEINFSKKEIKIMLKLQDLLEVGQIFRDEEIDTSRLARKLSCSELKLEQIVFKKFHTTVAELIAYYRVSFLIDLEKKSKSQISRAEKAAMAGFKTQIDMESAMSNHHRSKN